MNKSIVGSAIFLLAAIIVHATTSLAYFSANIASLGNSVTVGHFWADVRVGTESLVREKEYYCSLADGVPFVVDLTNMPASTLGFQYGISLQYYELADTASVKISKYEAADAGEVLLESQEGRVSMIPGIANPGESFRYEIAFTGGSGIIGLSFATDFKGCSPIEPKDDWPEEPDLPAAPAADIDPAAAALELEAEQEPTTEPTTEPETEPTTEPTTEPVTEAPTETTTLAPTEPPADAETDPAGEPEDDP